MFPSLSWILLSIFMGCMIQSAGIISGKRNKKFGYIVEITSGILAIGYVFYEHSFINGFIYIAFISSSYFSMVTLTSGHVRYEKIQEELQVHSVEEIELHREIKRIFLDISMTLIIFIFAILFLIFGPEASPLKYIISFGLLTAITELLKRILVYKNVRIYYCKDTEMVYIVSKYDLRKFSIHDCKLVQIESAVDMLKLHPLLTLFMSNTDFTTSSQSVLKLSLPGETVYMTLKDVDKWKRVFGAGGLKDSVDEQIMVLPFYHKRNMKRLLGKFYFAATVKGVSAYTGLLLLLYFLNIPNWLMVTIAIIYWGFNLYISDLVLKVAMDAKETTNQELINIAQHIFEKAGIPQTRIYETESSEYNGLATGMNIGKGMITLTTATLKLPIEVIEGILAHEAIHIKKRDIMWGQIWRAVYIILILFVILFIQENIHDIDAYRIPLFLLIWSIMFIFPIYQSFVSQWMEVRADHLGASLLKGGRNQMADSFRILTKAQDEEIHKSLTYSMSEDKTKKDKSSLERATWIWRMIEFQFMPHPPMYWRVSSLATNQNGWGKGILKRWATERLKESISK
ncbi:M56 family metallopeptidase [Metabacillus elymi]|uniref:M48 family metalloprotease n=1 Tax=Metabacillus elymi TaxID=2745198 RepID=A0ABX6SBX6_9BACI|nr:M56 family metallopeptidase [Metabacillus sp. KUDC1714]QNF30376.1 M48 family metalloprotease [Metabacillus sp. KUDC1714]